MSDLVIKATDSTFDSEIEQADIPVFVDFWAPWCGPCRMVAPFIDQIAEEYKGKLKVVKVDVDECPETARRYSVTSIPTLGLFKDGAVVKLQPGAMPLEQLKTFVEQVL